MGDDTRDPEVLFRQLPSGMRFSHVHGNGESTGIFGLFIAVALGLSGASSYLFLEVRFPDEVESALRSAGWAGQWQQRP